jgi:hypothetical protein
VGGCRNVRTDVLPPWARTGFSDPEPSGIPYVMGSNGQIIGVLFGFPLRAPPSPEHGNKILWVPRAVDGPGPLLIDARLDGSDLRVTRTVPEGPGPSGVDLPRPGCWHLQLRWPGAVDAVDLRYEDGSG